MAALAPPDQQQQARDRAREGIRARDRSCLQIGHDLLEAFPIGRAGHATGWLRFTAEMERGFAVATGAELGRYLDAGHAGVVGD